MNLNILYKELKNIKMKHTLKGSIQNRKVFLDNIELSESIVEGFKCQDEIFDWGQLSPGASKLALAVILTLTGSFDGYQKFKHEFIATLPLNEDFEAVFELDYSGVRENAIRDALTVNKYLTRKFLYGKSNRELLCFVHPQYREQYAKEMLIEKY